LGIRRQGRELALTYLYQLDLGVEHPETLEEAIERDGLGSKKVQEFARSRARGVWGHLQEIDALLTAHLEHWRLDRLTREDRGLLRLGVFEIAFDPEVPPKVAINEAVEIGRKFGGETSARFVNGVLDAVLHGPNQAP
jgi:transcription antitermination protein NusB